MSDSCNKDSVSSKSSSNGVCDVNNMMMYVSMADGKDIITSICANCGKEGSDINNVCNKCKQVKYCNAACKKKHRHKLRKIARNISDLLLNEQLNCMMKSYSNNLRRQKIVQFVIYEFLYF